jgi:hypothetical protein
MQITGDPFTENVLAALPRRIRRSLDEAQITALRAALSRVAAGDRRGIDLRISIPVFFQRYYLVFLFRKDKRSVVQRVLSRRRDEGNRIAMVGILTLISGLVALGLLTFLLVCLYAIKSQMGIDIFPKQHLYDFLISLT